MTPKPYFVAPGKELPRAHQVELEALRSSQLYRTAVSKAMAECALDLDQLERIAGMGNKGALPEIAAIILDARSFLELERALISYDDIQEIEPDESDLVGETVPTDEVCVIPSLTSGGSGTRFQVSRDENQAA